MTTTKATKTAPKPSELATADNAAITVQATEVAPIAADASAKWEAFTARPGIAATGSALNAAAAGIALVYAHEKEFATGQNTARFLFDSSKTILSPLFSLVWLALNHLYQVARKPETKASIAVKWQSLKAWVAPKYAYERSENDEAAIEL